MDRELELNGQKANIHIIQEYITKELIGRNVIVFTKNNSSSVEIGLANESNIQIIDSSDDFYEKCLSKIDEISTQNMFAFEIDHEIAVNSRQNIKNQSELSEVLDELEEIEYDKTNKRYKIYENIRKKLNLNKNESIPESIREQIDDEFEIEFQDKYGSRISDLEIKRDSIKQNIKDNKLSRNVIESNLKEDLQCLTKAQTNINVLLYAMHSCNKVQNAKLSKDKIKLLEDYEKTKCQVLELQLEKLKYEDMKKKASTTPKEDKKNKFNNNKIASLELKLEHIAERFPDIENYTIMSDDRICEALQLDKLANESISYIKTVAEQKRRHQMINEEQMEYRKMQRDIIENNELAKKDSDVRNTSLESIIKRNQKETGFIHNTLGAIGNNAITKKIKNSKIVTGTIPTKIRTSINKTIFKIKKFNKTTNELTSQLEEVTNNSSRRKW